MNIAKTFASGSILSIPFALLYSLSIQRMADGLLDAVGLFCQFFIRASLPKDILAHTFHKYWPQNVA